MVDKNVLVVTHPLAPASEAHVESLLNILAAITGVALVTTNLSESSSIRTNHEVIEISPHGMGDSIPVAMVRFIRNQLRMCRMVWRRDEEIVLFFGATSYLLPIAVARLIGKTVVLQPRGNVPLTLRLNWGQRIPNSLARVLAGIVAILERTGYRVSSDIITYTPAMADELGLKKYDSKLHPHGARYLDTDQFAPSIPFHQRELIVGYLGRLDNEKGIRMLVEAIKQLPDDITFRFIGDGDLRDWIKTSLATEIDEGSVECVGWIPHDEVPNQLNELRLLVLPSHPTEGLPTVILESMACGTPVYATPVSGVPDVINNGKTGFFLEESDPNKIASEIEEIVTQEDLSEVSEHARSFIVSEYQFENAVTRYESILNQL